MHGATSCARQIESLNSNGPRPSWGANCDVLLASQWHLPDRASVRIRVIREIRGHPLAPRCPHSSRLYETKALMSHSSDSASHAGREPNRLAKETSPYLQQHQWNPVDWYPWGEEAFEAARMQDKPIFLSVGYSACHWCHVMERESFEDEGIAELLNRHFISVKVDREERPDVDQIYMSAVQLITRRGGWPMSVFMTHDGKPFYGGTYWPPTSRMGMPGFRDIVTKLADYWNHKRDEVDSSADDLVEAIQRMAAPAFEKTQLDEQVLRNAMEELISSADRVRGGFGSAPKFPHPMDIRFLLRAWKRFGNEDAREIALQTLSKMANGGIYDHLGGGFHRYSTDANWLVPHFEKMLYDNALLVPAYLEAYQITADEEHARVVRETLDYVLREMTAPNGGFYSTQDADSEGVEGKFFVWKDAEIDQLLPESDAVLFKAAYDVSPAGNWEGSTILNRPRPLEDVADELAVSLEELNESLARSRQTLFDHRSRRIAPGRDEKILTAWNGMMISAFAQAALVLNEPRYLDAARSAAAFLLSTVRDEQGRLLHAFKDDQARFMAYLDDYACLIDGLIDLFQASSDPSSLKSAVALAEDAISRFSDPDTDAFFYTANDHEALIARTRDVQDNAMPSGNGMMATALERLSHLTSRTDFAEQAAAILDSCGAFLQEHPRAAGQSLIALDNVLGPAYEVVVTAGENDASPDLWFHLWSNYHPRVVAFQWKGDSVEAPLAALVEGKSVEGTARAYVCQHGSCSSPAESPEALNQALQAGVS